MGHVSECVLIDSESLGKPFRFSFLSVLRGRLPIFSFFILLSSLDVLVFGMIGSAHVGFFLLPWVFTLLMDYLVWRFLDSLGRLVAKFIMFG